MTSTADAIVVGYVKPGAQSWYPFTYLEMTRALSPEDIVRGQVSIEGGDIGLVIELDAPSDPYPAMGSIKVVGESLLTESCFPFKLVPERDLVAGEKICYDLWLQQGAPPRRRVIVRRPM